MHLYEKAVHRRLLHLLLAVAGPRAELAKQYATCKSIMFLQRRTARSITTDLLGKKRAFRARLRACKRRKARSALPRTCCRK